MKSQKEIDMSVNAGLNSYFLENPLVQMVASVKTPLTKEKAVKVMSAVVEASVRASEPEVFISVKFETIPEILFAQQTIADALKTELMKEHLKLKEVICNGYQFEFTNGSAICLGLGK